MIDIDEMIAVNDNHRVAPYRFNWWDLFVVVSCSLIAAYIAAQGIGAVLYVIAGI